MEYVHVSKEGTIATLALSRGKVNALNEETVEELHQTFRSLEDDQDVRAVILTGQGKFFSFGFDVPEFLSYSKDEFTRYLHKFTDLYTYLFLYPKPLVVALNGHAVGGGCMLATTGDYRLMVSGKAKIALNEINFGSSVFAGSVEILKYCVGEKNAERFLCGGEMHLAEEAAEIGLVDQVCSNETLKDEARKVAEGLAKKDGQAFAGIKGLLRKPVAQMMVERERESIEEFIEIWYSESTWEQLKDIQIHS